MCTRPGCPSFLARSDFTIFLSSALDRVVDFYPNIFCEATVAKFEKFQKNWITFQMQLFFPREMGHFRWPVKFSCFNSSTSWGFFSSFETWHPMSLQIIPSFFLEMREITIRLQLSEKIISGNDFENIWSFANESIRLLVQSWFNIRLLIGNFYEKTTTMKER